MAIKLLCQLLLLGIGITFLLPSQAQAPAGQTILMETHFSCIVGEPTWLLIVRDVQTGQVLPYVYEIHNQDNFWIAFTEGHSYRITASNLTFGPYAKIANFCHLENGIISGESYWVSLTGALSPDPHSFKCHVTRYKNMSIFPIANLRRS